MSVDESTTMPGTVTSPPIPARSYDPTPLLSDATLADLVELLFAKEPGERIPSERELAEQLGVSRTAVRDRINRLTALGALRREERAGTFFTGIRPDALSDALMLSLHSSSLTVESLVSVRHALERQAAIEASLVGDQQAIAEIGVAVQRMQASEDGDKLREHDRSFHEALFAASHSPGLLFFSRMLHPLMSGLLRTVLLEQDRETMRVLHAAIYEAVRDGAVERVSQAIDAHFEWLYVLLEREAEAALTGSD